MTLILEPGTPNALPCFWAKAFGMIETTPGMYCHDGSGVFSLTTTVPGAPTLTDLTEEWELPSWDASFGSRWRPSENATSSAVSGVPSQNLTPLRTVYT